MASAGTIRGTAMAPGVSRNGRWYKPEVIAKAVARAQERIAEGTVPITMWTHHGAEDDTTRVVGRLTSLEVAPDGRARFAASIVDTPEGQKIVALTDEDDPYVTGVSIRGWWLEDPRMEVAPDGQLAETADDLEINGLDFTTQPGVLLARIGEQHVPPGRAITESITEVLVEANKKPYGDVQYADPGYQADKVKRYPIDTKAHAKAAWSYVHQKDNAGLYTANQLKRIRGRISAALKKFGVTVGTENITTDEGSAVFEAVTRVSEITECYGSYGDEVGTAGFSVSLYNGPLTISVSAYRGIEAEQLAAIGQAAMAAAIQAVGVLDPDTDGDVDGPGSIEGGPDDNQMESAPAGGAPVVESEQAATEPPAEPEAAAAEDDADQAEEAAAAAGEAEESLEDRIVRRLLERLQPAPAAAEDATGEPAPVVEAAPADSTAVTETEEQARDRIRVEERDRLLGELRNGSVTLARKGIVPARVGEAVEPPKPLHEMSNDEFHAYQRTIGAAEYFIP